MKSDNLFATAIEAPKFKAVLVLYPFLFSASSQDSIFIVPPVVSLSTLLRGCHGVPIFKALWVVPVFLGCKIVKAEESFLLCRGRSRTT